MQTVTTLGKSDLAIRIADHKGFRGADQSTL